MDFLIITISVSPIGLTFWSLHRYKIVQTKNFLKQIPFSEIVCLDYLAAMFEIHLKQDDDCKLDGGLLIEQLHYTDHVHLNVCGNHVSLQHQ